MATTRKPAARKPKAHFSIAQAEAELTEGLDEIEPFTVELKSGEIVTFVDPRSMGWQKAASLDMSNPYGMFRELVEEEDYEKLVNEDFPLSLITKLGQAWRDHYGVEEQLQPGN